MNEVSVQSSRSLRDEHTLTPKSLRQNAGFFFVQNLCSNQNRARVGREPPIGSIRRELANVGDERSENERSDCSTPKARPTESPEGDAKVSPSSRDVSQSFNAFCARDHPKGSCSFLGLLNSSDTYSDFLIIDSSSFPNRLLVILTFYKTNLGATLNRIFYMYFTLVSVFLTNLFM